MKNPKDSIVKLFILGTFILFSFVTFSQNTPRIIRENKRGKVVKQINDGEKIKVFTLENYPKVKKYKGHLKIVSDSTILVGNKILRIDSICQFTRGVQPRLLIGRSLMFTGSGLIALDIALIIHAANGKIPGYASLDFLKAVIGLAGGGYLLFMAGEEISIKYFHKIDSKTKIKIIN